MYEKARDSVLEKLGAAFGSPDKAKSDDAFLSFIGYPPVLDAIATLLRTESNYHRIGQALDDASDGDLEVKLLIRIASFLLTREREEKALPNFIDSIADKSSASVAQVLREGLYNHDEQCARVLARALNRDFPIQLVADTALNEEYEKALATWCPEHPFLNETRVRNAVFEAVAVARCAMSPVVEYQDLASEYAVANRPTYHLLYILAQFAAGKEINARFLNVLIQACSDFVGRGHQIDIEMNGVAWDEPEVPQKSSIDLDIVIAVPTAKQERAFKFSSTVSTSEVIRLGPFLANANIILPCDAELQGMPAIDCVGSCRVSARKVLIEATDLNVRAISRVTQTASDVEAGLFLDVAQAQGRVNAVAVKGSAIEINCIDHGLAYPLAKYVTKTERVIADRAVAEKFRRLRRILSEFASHSKGGLAKYRAKIEHERVLQGAAGRNVLAQLLKEDILSSDAKFYYVDSDRLSQVLGTTWHQLRQHKLSKLVEAFLRRVP